MSGAQAPWPLELRLRRSANLLEVAFDDGRRVSLDASTLRRASPSAADHGHAPKAERRPINIDEGLKLVDLRPIGRYAVQLVFSDGHDSGFYTWPLLYGLGSETSGESPPAGAKA